MSFPLSYYYCIIFIVFYLVFPSCFFSFIFFLSSVFEKRRLFHGLVSYSSFFFGRLFISYIKRSFRKDRNSRLDLITRICASETKGQRQRSSQVEFSSIFLSPSSLQLSSSLSLSLSISLFFLIFLYLSLFFQFYLSTVQEKAQILVNFF